MCDVQTVAMKLLLITNMPVADKAVVLKVTEFTHSAGSIYLMHIFYSSSSSSNSSSSSSSSSAAAATVIVVRNGCYNYYLPPVMLCNFSGTWIMRRKMGENVRFAQVKTIFCCKVGAP